jgi:cytochrome c-type biogenesis protein CcmF
MFAGFTGSAFNQDTTIEVRQGDRFRLGRYELAISELREGDNENYSWQRALVSVYRGGELIESLEPERRFYKASRQPSAVVSIRRRLDEDLYLNFAGMSEDNQRAVMQAYVFPLVSWIWLGSWVLMSGAAVCLVPSKARLEYPRTEVVGVTGAHVQAGS